MNVRIVVPRAGPLFDGHFPGLPILPGVAELIMVAGALAPTAALTRVHHVRFRGLVRPGTSWTSRSRGLHAIRAPSRRGAIAGAELEFNGRGNS